MNRSRKSCSHDYGSRGSRTKTDFLKQSQRAVGRRPASASMAFPLHHCHKSCRWLVARTEQVLKWSWVDRTGDTVKQSERCVTSPTVIEACLLTTRSKMFRQHLKCSLTAPKRAGTSSGFFCCCFFLLSQLSDPGRLATALCGPASRLASAMTFSGCDTSPTVDCCSFSICRTQSPEELGRVGERSLGWTDCRAATLTFFFFFNAYAEKERTRREGRYNSPLGSQ